MLIVQTRKIVGIFKQIMDQQYTTAFSLFFLTFQGLVLAGGVLNFKSFVYLLQFQIPSDFSSF